MTTIRNKILEILNYPLEKKIVVVLSHKNMEIIGIRGKIKEESKNMICIYSELDDRETKEIWISKADGIFLFKPNIKIDGSLLLGKHKTRAKRRLKSW